MFGHAHRGVVVATFHGDLDERIKAITDEIRLAEGKQKDKTGVRYSMLNRAYEKSGVRHIHFKEPHMLFEPIIADLP